MRRAITIEISRILELTTKNCAYMERSDHYWLQTGRPLSTAPVAFGLHDQAFAALLPDLHKIGGTNFSKVIAFYSHYRYCENLRTELFRAVQRHCDSNQIVSTSERSLWDAERRRVVSAYRILCREFRGAVSIADLRLQYDLPSSEEVEIAAQSK